MNNQPLTVSMFRNSTECQRAIDLRNKILNDTTTDENGAILWNSNGQPVPAHCFEEAVLDIPAAQGEAINTATNAAINAYILGRANRSPEQRAEEAFEQRAAFGTGVELVNVLTGERTVT